MSKDDYRIWSNADLDYEEWKDWMEEEYPTLSDDERVAMMYEENGHYLEDERLNLDIQLSQPILVVADLGLWNGRRTGYKEIPSGNIRDCLYSDYYGPGIIAIDACTAFSGKVNCLVIED